MIHKVHTLGVQGIEPACKVKVLPSVILFQPCTFFKHTWSTNCPPFQINIFTILDIHRFEEAPNPFLLFTPCPGSKEAVRIIFE